METITKTAEENQINLESQQQRATPATVANSSPVIPASSSPSHEFSFTISLHSSATTTATSYPASTDKTKQHPQQQSQPPPLAIDLSPADEIFFHGHLLPLHFLSHLHTSSPRPSTHSLDSFALPNKHESKARATESSNISCSTCNEDDHCISFNKENDDESNIEINLHSCETTKEGTNDKSKSSFSLFGLPKRKKAPSEAKEKSSSEGISEHNKSRKLKFDVSQFLKRYLNMVKPLLSPRGGRRENNVRGRRQSYSFSGTVSPRDNREALMRGKRGEFSAPASMRTSPTNSGLLLATAGVASPVTDSTMEELQAAIQAAIAHCKNSISSEDKSQELSSVPVNEILIP